MTDIRDIIAKNISELRSEMKITQFQLAEVLNYSDKAVSKWERGEAVPDVSVLKQIADYFGVTVDYLLTDEHDDYEKKRAKRICRSKNTSRYTIAALVFSVIWLIATVIFVEMNVVYPDAALPSWMMFIYAIPVSALSLRLFNSRWGVKRINFIFNSIIAWTLILSVYLTFLTAYAQNFWLVFIIGVPVEVIILLVATLYARKGD